MRQKFRITGMSCAMCVKAISDAVGSLNGVTSCEVSLLAGLLTVEYDPTILKVADIISAVDKEGYGISLIDVKKYQVILPYQAEQKQYRKQLLWTLILFVPLFVCHLAQMLGNWAFFIQNQLYLTLFSAILGLTIAGINYRYYVRGLKAIINRHASMDTLIAVSTFCAYAYSIYEVIRLLVLRDTDAYSHLHFETGSMILLFVTVGKYLESFAKHHAATSIEKLIANLPQTAQLLTGDTIPIEEVQVNEVICVRAGEKISLDGVIVSGSSDVNQSVVTGEAVPINKQVGDSVIGGTLNGLGYLEIRVTKTADSGIMQQIIDLMAETSANKAPMARLADRLSGVFVPIIIGIAAITFGVWYLISADFDFALTFAMAVMVISCPCALGLATPTSILVGTSLAAEHGIMIRNAEALEELVNIDTVLLDKTNTMTDGAITFQKMICETGISEEEALKIAYSLECHSAHPLAKAIVQKGQDLGLSAYPGNDFLETPGRGITGEVNGIKYFIGNHPAYSDHLIRLMQDDTVMATFCFSDNIKENTRQAIANLHEQGMTIVVVTGDSRENALLSLNDVQVDDLVADALPLDKEHLVSSYQRNQHHVLMIGDGINDSAALLSANVGIAIGGSMDIAIESADIVLLNNDLGKIEEALVLGKKVHRNIKQNLFWALFYNLLAIPSAAGVYYNIFGWQLNPRISALAMSLSSLIVVLNAIRLKRVKLGGK